jgi:transposase
MRRTRRNHAPGFKAKAIKGDKTLAKLAEYFGVHPNQISEWKQQLQESAADVFGGSPKVKVAEPDLKVLHAKIGQLTLENDFLESALTKPVLSLSKGRACPPFSTPTRAVNSPALNSPTC